MLQQKISHAETKTRCSQINILFFFFLKEEAFVQDDEESLNFPSSLRVGVSVAPSLGQIDWTQ